MNSSYQGFPIIVCVQLVAGAFTAKSLLYSLLERATVCYHFILFQIMRKGYVHISTHIHIHTRNTFSFKTPLVFFACLSFNTMCVCVCVCCVHSLTWGIQMSGVRHCTHGLLVHLGWTVGRCDRTSRSTVEISVSVLLCYAPSMQMRV